MKIAEQQGGYFMQLNKSLLISNVKFFTVNMQTSIV